MWNSYVWVKALIRGQAREVWFPYSESLKMSSLRERTRMTQESRRGLEIGAKRETSATEGNLCCCCCCYCC